jgi:hypothetical protein
VTHLATHDAPRTPDTDPVRRALRAAAPGLCAGPELSLEDPALAVSIHSPRGYAWTSHLASLSRAFYVRHEGAVYVVTRHPPRPPADAVLRLLRWGGERQPPELYRAPLAKHLGPGGWLALGPFPMPDGDGDAVPARV